MQLHKLTGEVLQEVNAQIIRFGRVQVVRIGNKSSNAICMSLTTVNVELK